MTGPDVRYVGSESEPRENRLLLDAATGSRVAFESLVEVLAPAVFGLIDELSNRRGAAEAWTTEVFAELWRDASNFDPSNGSAHTWVMASAHRITVSRLRALGDAASRAGVRAPTGSRADDRSLDRQSCAGRIVTTTSAPMDDELEAIELAYFRAMTYLEIAAHLGVSPDEIKRRIRTGLARMGSVSTDTIGSAPARTPASDRDLAEELAQTVQSKVEQDQAHGSTYEFEHRDPDGRAAEPRSPAAGAATHPTSPKVHHAHKVGRRVGDP